MEPFDTKLNALTVRPRIYNVVWAPCAYLCVTNKFSKSITLKLLLFIQVGEPADVNATLYEIRDTLALNDSYITQLQESRDIEQLARTVSMFASIVNSATRLSTSSYGNTSVANNMTAVRNMTANETRQFLEEAQIRLDVSVVYLKGLFYSLYNYILHPKSSYTFYNYLFTQTHLENDVVLTLYQRHSGVVKKSK